MTAQTDLSLELSLDRAGTSYVDPANRRTPAPVQRDAEGHPWAIVPAQVWAQRRTTLRVEAWVHTDQPATEGLACAVSAWSTRRKFDLFDAHDAAGTSGLDAGGFLGAIFDGRYVYFVPQHDSTRRSGTVLRCDTHEPFESRAAYVAYDAGRTARMDTRGYYGAAFDGRYVYFVPRKTEQTHHSRVLRYDTKAAFTDPRSWDAHDAGLAISFQGAAFDGRFVYFCPGYANDSQTTGVGTILRLDSKGAFHDQSSWATYDATLTSGLRAANFDGGAFDGRYIYFIPLGEGAVLRFDTQARFDNPCAWTAHDVARLGVERCVGSVFDGRFLYLVPYGVTRVVVRYDTHRSFTDPRSWQAYDASTVSGLRTLGYDGGMFDGRYVYFIPFWDEDGHFHTNVTRYDTLGDFDDRASWSAIDASHIGNLHTCGYNAGAFDGRYIYCAPWHDGSRYGSDCRIVGHARILRYDTAGDEAIFSLRYCDYGHNGGLCAATPGPSFLVNTDRGVRSVAAHERLEAGEHHLVGEYDGRQIRLSIDGRAVAQREASGALLDSKVDLTIGRLARDARGFLPGVVTKLRVGS